MDYTKNYHLPQWVKEDRIMMEDFNQMCADMEAGLLDVRARAEEGDAAVRSAAASASASAASAQSTANTALAKANAAYSPSQKPYVIGTYTGNGDTLTINLGFKPSFVIAAHQKTVSYSGSMNCSVGFAMAGGGIDGSGLTILDNGFAVSIVIINHIVSAPHINESNTQYAYIAFR